MKSLLIVGFLIACFPAPAQAQVQGPVQTRCPGRNAIIFNANHPSLASVRDKDSRSGWAQRTQAEIESCVSDATISRAYGYYLDLVVMSRMVRYVCLLGDADEKRQALGTFDSIVLETRPALLGSAFSSLTNDLQEKTHSDCQKGVL